MQSWIKLNNFEFEADSNDSNEIEKGINVIQSWIKRDSEMNKRDSNMIQTCFKHDSNLIQIQRDWNVI